MYLNAHNQSKNLPVNFTTNAIVIETRNLSLKIAKEGPLKTKNKIEVFQQ